ncbi:hypothetical protein [Methylobacterium sp. 77]|uniref:hypothetical protein n=1 Tax=Methylobacterium sp. 77 TaxID=1101192 RepID=UPI000374AEA0|nr:hypothetical protein [Methylobacterium sp. 77]
MAAIDACHARFGRGAVVPVHVGLMAKRERIPNVETRTPRRVTQVGERPTAASTSS